MYLRQIRVRNVKLLRDVSLSFVDASGAPRMWTVLIGENGLCKTALLQAIAAAAIGPRASQLVDVAAFPDRRVEDEVAIDAEFGFSQERHAYRAYPGLTVKQAGPPVLGTELHIEPGSKLFYGISRYIGQAPPRASAGADQGDLLERARAPRRGQSACPGACPGNRGLVRGRLRPAPSAAAARSLREPG